MRTSTAYFAGAGTVVAAIVAGLGGGLLFANIVHPSLIAPTYVAADPAANRIYVANYAPGHSVTVIDGVQPNVRRRTPGNE